MMAPISTLALKSCRNVTSSAVACYSLSDIWPLLKEILLPSAVSFYTFSSQVFCFVIEQLKYSWFNLLIEWKSIPLFRVGFPPHQLGEPVPLMPHSNYLTEGSSWEHLLFGEILSLRIILVQLTHSLAYLFWPTVAPV